MPAFYKERKRLLQKAGIIFILFSYALREAPLEPRL